MSEHTPTPWRVYTTKSGLKIVGIGAANGEGILDAGFGVWSWNDPEGIANANMVVKAVNNHGRLVEALKASYASFERLAAEFDKSGDGVNFALCSRDAALAANVLNDLIARGNT